MQLSWQKSQNSDPAKEEPRSVMIRLGTPNLCVISSMNSAALAAVAEPPELSRLKCAGHHHKGNTDTNALQTEQFLVCRVTSR